MIAIYTRLSKEDEDSNSIEHQTNEGVTFAESLKLPYVIYNEGEGVSGTLEIEQRPQLFNLIQDIKDNKITHVWFRNQNRLSRNNDTYHFFISIATKYNLKVYFDNKLFDVNDPSQNLLGGILSNINTYQAKLQSHQTKKVLKQNVSKGLAHGILPYGYGKDENGVLIIDPEESKIVKRIYDLSLKGTGTKTIANILNEEGVKTRYNKINKGTVSVKNKYTGKVSTTEKKAVKWAGNTIRNIIINTIYKGIRNFSGEQYKVPIIIEPRYWKKVNENLKNNANNSGKKTQHKYLLKGLLRCGKCGRNMYGRTRNNKKDNYYMCSSKRYKELNCGNRSISIPKMEGIIWSRFFAGPHLLELIKKDIKKEDTQVKEIEELVEKHKTELVKYQNQSKKLLQLSIEGIFTVDEIKKQKQQIQSKIEEQEKYIEDYTTQLENNNNSKKLIGDFENDFESYASENITFLEKKEIINKYIKNIVVKAYEDDINIYFIDIEFKINKESEKYLYDKRFILLPSIKNEEPEFYKKPGFNYVKWLMTHTYSVY